MGGGEASKGDKWKEGCRDHLGGANSGEDERAQCLRLSCLLRAIEIERARNRGLQKLRTLLFIPPFPRNLHDTIAC